MGAYRSAVAYRNSSTYPGGVTPPSTTATVAPSGVFAAVQKKRKYIFPYWEVEEEQAREREREIAREKEIEEAEAAQEQAEEAAPPAPVIDEAQLQSLADSLTAASLEAVAARRPVEQPKAEAIAPTVVLPDDLFFKPIIPIAVPFNDDAEIMECIAMIEAIEAMEADMARERN